MQQRAVEIQQPAAALATDLRDDRGPGAFVEEGNPRH